MITAVIQRGVGTLLESLPPAAQRCAIQTTQARNCLLERQGDRFIARTNAAGEACFFLQVGQADEEEEDIEVEVAARDLSDVAPVRFLVIVGEIDTPDIPLDLALNATGDRLFVADRRSGLRIIDVSEPTTPRLLRTVNLDGTEVRLRFAADATLGERLYVGTNFPLRVYVATPSGTFATQRACEAVCNSPSPPYNATASPGSLYKETSRMLLPTLARQMLEPSR